ncbi:MAG: hypothetical protein WC700_10170 [Gemmatimonadaceae bacterium]|jgi:hypothetical protein
MSGGQTTFTQFGPDPPLEDLPKHFRACIEKPGTPGCDALVGSAASGNGYCSRSQYAQTTYCACVNNAIPCAGVVAAACVNSEFAYRPTAIRAPAGEDYLACKNLPICINVVEVGGNQNVVQNIKQECGPITNITNIINANPTLAILVFVLVVALVILMRMSVSDDNGAPPPARLVVT